MPGILDPRERAPVIVLRSFDASVAPHANTIRWAYTVPDDKFARVELLSLMIMRDAAPASPGYVQLWVEIGPLGGAVTIVAFVSEIGNAVGVPRSLPFSPDLLLLPGDFIRCRSLDTSTGGTVYFNAGLKATAYDL